MASGKAGAVHCEPVDSPSTGSGRCYKLVSKWDNLKIVSVLEGQVASGALPKTGGERVCGNGLSQHVAVSELEDDGHRIGRCASRFLCLLRHNDLHPSTPGIVCVIPGIGALWLFQHELLGISIDAGTLTHLIHDGRDFRLASVA
jgi:hypothetical protein